MEEDSCNRIIVIKRPSVHYKCDNFYNKESEGAILWCDDPLPLFWSEHINAEDIIVSDKDRMNKRFNEIDNPF